MLPTLTTFAQFLAVGLRGVRNHYPKCRDITPRVAFLLPAWNEADVLGSSIGSLMSIDYPAGQWRIQVADDASADRMPDVMRAKWGRDRGFAVAPEWMREYRAAETSQPMANCEIIELKAADH
jgi:cellulose synthase/poly-beta-1,6-N-acetylglucosamine synthase-like glycosyltransferase